MPNNFGYIMSAAILLVCVGVTAVDRNWGRIEKENNAFAKDCNDRGGEVHLEFNMRQCLGAKPTKDPK